MTPFTPTTEQTPASEKHPAASSEPPVPAAPGVEINTLPPRPLPGEFIPEHIFTDEERRAIEQGEKTLSRQEFPRNTSPPPPGSEHPLPPPAVSLEKIPDSQDDLWLRQKEQKRNFLAGLDAAHKWAPLLTGDMLTLPPETRAGLYSPDFPEEIQQDEAAADIVSDWTAAHLPEPGADQKTLRKNWNFFRESVSETLETPPDNQTLFQEISRRNKHFLDTVQALSREKETLLPEAVKRLSGYASPHEKETRQQREEALSRLPEEHQENARLYLLSQEEETRHEAGILAPLYKNMREAIKNLADMEAFEQLTPENPAQKTTDFQPGLYAPFRLSELGKTAQSLKKTALRLGELTDRQRAFLFHQVEEDIIAEREAAPPPTPDMAESLMQAVSRSHLKTGYGLINAAAGYLALISDLTAEGADALGVTPRFGAGLKKNAEEIRTTVSDIQRLRTLAEERQSPLAPHQDGRGAGPQRHWLKQCLVGFSEESVAIALALAYPPALIGYGAGEAGEHYAQNESSYRRRKETSPAAPTLPPDRPLAANTRFLAALVSGSLQTLIEAGAYGKTFKPLIKNLPKTSKTLALTVRPYAEQKGIALAQPLGETLSDYASGLIQKEHSVEANADNLARALGTWESNGGDYLASLPFVLLAGGKITLSQLRSKKTALNSPLLQSHYRISDDLLRTIREEPHSQKQNELLTNALRESAVWRNAGEREKAATLLNAVEYHRRGSDLEWRVHTAQSLGKLLKLSPDKQTAPASLKNDGRLLPRSGTEKSRPTAQTFSAPPPFDKARLKWHLDGELPSLLPVRQKGGTLWKFAPNRNSFRLLKDETFSSPAEAFTAWQRHQESRTLSSRRQLLSPRIGLFKAPSLSDHQRNDSDIRRTLKAMNTIAPQKTLLTANLNPPRRQTAKALDTLLKKEQDRTKAQIIEDCLLYAEGKAPEDIAGHRITRIWADDLRSGRIPEPEARAWVKYWEQETGEKLTASLPPGISPRLPHAALASKLADLTLWPPVRETSALLPPAFTETARLAQEQLAHAAALADILTGTSHYKSRLKLHSTPETALSQTLTAYLEIGEHSARKYSTYRTSKKTPPPAKKTPLPSEELLQDIRWMQEQDCLPVFSINKPGSPKKHWITAYPDGTLSSPHQTPREAVLDWFERGDSLLPRDLREQGEKSAAELLDFYGPIPGVNIALRKNSPPPKNTGNRLQKERNDIFFRANPHLAPQRETLRLRTGGINREERTPLGHIHSQIDLFDPGDPFAIIEEHAESIWKHHLKNRFLNDREAAEELFKLEKQTGQKYLPGNFLKLDAERRRMNLVEGLSQASTEYLLGRQGDSRIPEETSRWIRELYASPFKPPHAVPLLRRAAALKQTADSQSLSPRFLHLLQDSTGLNPAFRRERLLTPAALPQREKIIPHLSSPSSLLETLPAPAREQLVDKLSPPGTGATGNTKERFRQAALQLRNLEHKLAQTPALAEWDQSPKSRRYRRADENSGKTAYPHTLKDLETAGLQEEDLEAIHLLSLLRRSLDNSPHTAENGIRWGKRLFSPDSAARPGGLPPRWQTSAPTGEYGLRYTDPTRPEHLIRLSPGNPYSPHEKTRTPYIRHLYNGHFLNSRGEPSSSSSPDTYIPLEKFHYDKKKLPQTNLPPRLLPDMLSSLGNPQKLAARIGNKTPGKIADCRELIFELNTLAERRPLTVEQSRLVTELKEALEQLPEHPGANHADIPLISQKANELLKSLSKRNT